MKDRYIIAFLSLVVIASVALPICSIYADALVSVPYLSGSCISTGYKDWDTALDNMGNTIEESYLQLEASWYNEAYDIYKIHLYFSIPDNLTSATLTFIPTGVIYNQDDIKLMVIDAYSNQLIGEVELSNLKLRAKTTVELNVSRITTGSLILMTSNEWYNLPPLKWNWITLNNHSDKPYLTYDYGAMPVTPTPTAEATVIETVTTSSLNYGAIAGGVIGLLAIVGLLIWRFAR